MGFAQDLMQNEVFSQIYEKAWRPLFTRGFSAGRSSTADYDRALRHYLARPGERTVLDVACGPGNYSEDLSRGLTGDGRYVGVDFSPAMVAQAVRNHRRPRVSFLRADARSLPFADGGFDSVVCLAALYLIPDPFDVIDELVRVTRPGGEVILFATVRSGPSTLPGITGLVSLTGLRIFGHSELLDRLRMRGMVNTEQTICGVGQYVRARKPLDA